MTAREIDMLKEFLGREIATLREALHEMRKEASEDHAKVRVEIERLTTRVSVLEDSDAIEESREEFRKSLRRDVVKLASGLIAAAAAISPITFQLIDHL